MYKSINGEQVLYGREFVRKFADRTGMSYKEAKDVTSVFFQMLTEAMASNTAVCFRNFGVFGIRVTDERIARNPKTKDEHLIPAGYKPEFKASEYLRKTVDRKIKEGISGKEDPYDRERV